MWGEARNPGSPAAVSGELEGIPEEVFGWNGSELNSGGIHVRFSRNRRWNSGGWHRPGEAESGGFWGCRGTPDFFSGRCAGQQIRPMRAPIKLLHLGGNFGGFPRPVVPYGTLPCPPGGRVPLAPWRQGSSGPWAAGKLWVGHLTDLPWNPRPPVAIPGELEGIPEEVSGWNGSELNSERIHVRFSRNRRWNSGGWHRPGEAESGGFLWGGPPGGPLGLV